MADENSITAAGDKGEGTPHQAKRRHLELGHVPVSYLGCHRPRDHQDTGRFVRGHDPSRRRATHRAASQATQITAVMSRGNENGVQALGDKDYHQVFGSSAVIGIALSLIPAANS
jgi:hypothetical protein